MNYDHRKIESKWQNFWDENDCFRIKNDFSLLKFFVLDMCIYPSGKGLHVGHIKQFTGSDTIARYKRMLGFNVLYPMGWDAFGLPAEQYALNTGNDPQEFTLFNINNIRNQLKKLGFSYNFNKEINTSDPDYYKWTQWIFIKLFKKGLAELKETEVNWCPGLNTVLANEEIINIDNKMFSERGNFPVEKRIMKQWVLKITKYADRLLNDLKNLDWPENIKKMQVNWIGKKEGTIIFFNIKNSKKDKILEVFTDKIELIFGAKFILISPYNRQLKEICLKKNWLIIEKKINESKNKKDFFKKNEKEMEKLILFTGRYGINPFVEKIKLPIYVSFNLIKNNLMSKLGIPCDNEKDKKIANLKKIKIINIFNENLLINSFFLNNLTINQAKIKINKYIKKTKKGYKKNIFKLKDWIFSRQRYWGEPIPIIHWENGKLETVKEKDLPIKLPYIKNLEKGNNEVSPLVNAKSWIKVFSKEKGTGLRDLNTMPQWAGSSWYYLAYIINNNQSINLNSKKSFELFKYWLPIDIYIGGKEHAVSHLLYSRFWHKVLYDLKIVPTIEPFQKLYNQGLILGENGEKMSKSKNNTVSPDEMVAFYGADSLRVYLMFAGPFNEEITWNSKGIISTKKWLNRIFLLFTKNKDWLKEEKEKSLEEDYHKLVQTVTYLFDQLKFNKVISELMIFINKCYQKKRIWKTNALNFLKLLYPIAPHMSEELWSYFNNYSLTKEKWPKYNPELVKIKKNTLIIQINGVTKKVLKIPLNYEKEKEIINLINENKIMKNFKLSEEKIIKNFYFKKKDKKIINFLTKK
jgi:leucyl-tRNA synthetase